LIVTITGLFAVVVAFGLGLLVQRRLFPEAKLGPFAYVVTTVVMGGAWGTAAALGLIAVTS
jgi:nitrate reductase gamma subunit